MKPIHLPNHIQTLLDQLDPSQDQLVLATGVFDLLHTEHINFLRKASQAGSFLLVGIEPDTRVKTLKGPNRPIHPQHQRLTNVLQLSCVNAAFILPPSFGQLQTRQQLLSQIKPHILAVSSHTPHLTQKHQLIQSQGGRLEIVHTHNPRISTTQLIQQQKDEKRSKLQ